ncbi:hypothetical protein P8452_01235 [Trifolium repens]|nr:hypothetical protein P8452_01235 [Trifolium repens]
MSFHHQLELHRIITQNKKLVKIFGEEINYFDIKSVEVKEEEDVEGATKEVIDLSDDENEEECEEESDDDEYEIVKKPQRRTSKRKIHMDLDSSSNRGGMAKR